MLGAIPGAQCEQFMMEGKMGGIEGAGRSTGGGAGWEDWCWGSWQVSGGGKRLVDPKGWLSIQE